MATLSYLLGYLLQFVGSITLIGCLVGQGLYINGCLEMWIYPTFGMSLSGISSASTGDVDMESKLSLRGGVRGVGRGTGTRPESADPIGCSLSDTVPLPPSRGRHGTQGPHWPWGLGDIRGEPLVIGSITLRKTKGKKGQLRHRESLWLRPVVLALGEARLHTFQANLVNTG